MGSPMIVRQIVRPVVRPILRLVEARTTGGAVSGQIFPTVASAPLATEFMLSNSNSHLVALGPTYAAGDIIGIVWAQDGAPTTTTPAGWTKKAETTDTPTDYTCYVFEKVAAGNEGGTTVDLVTSVVERGAAIVYRVSAGTYTGTGQVQVAAETLASTSSDPPLITPAWGSGKMLVFAVSFVGQSMTAAPTYPYADGNTYSGQVVTPSTNDATVALCWAQVDAASANPGAFTLNAVSNSCAMTIAYRGATV